MVSKLPIFNARFWKILKYLDNLNDITSLEDLKRDLSLPELKDSDLVEVINFLQKFNYDVRLIVNNSNVYIHPFEDKEGIQITLSFSEWIALQAHFPLLASRNDQGVGEDLMEKMNLVMSQYPSYDLYAQVEKEESKNEILNLFHMEKKRIIEIIEAAINNLSILSIFSKNGQLEIFPQRIVYLEKQLTLISENTKDKKMESIHISDITNITIEINKDYRQNFTSMEIDDYIYALRAVNGDEERLILKVLSDEKLDFSPPFQFMGTPYKTSNMNGDSIWAASVEISEPLMEWLYQLKSNIEILDPIHLKEKFNQYCQRRIDAEKYRKVS